MIRIYCFPRDQLSSKTDDNPVFELKWLKEPVEVCNFESISNEIRLAPEKLIIKEDTLMLSTPPCSDLPFPNQKSIEKNPISELQEMCAKRAWPAPVYNILSQTGPPHDRRFMFQVKVNLKNFQPKHGSPTKQEAKAAAAKYALMHFKC